MRFIPFMFLFACVDIVRPSEDGPQEAVLLGVPTYENAIGRGVEEVQLQMIASLLPTVGVDLVVNDPAELTHYSDRLVSDYGVSPALLVGLQAVEVEHTDIWFRDMGGVFVEASLAGHGSSQAIVDYQFDGWGYGPFSDEFSNELYAIDDEVAVGLADAYGIPIIPSEMTTEGGAFESNGLGTVMYSLQALTQRNPGWTQTQIEAEFERTLGATHVIGLPVFHPLDGHAVLDGPNYADDGTPLHMPVTVRHLDVVARFVDSDTILVGQFPQADVTNQVEQEIHDALQAAWDFFAVQVDQDGQPFELIAFPDPGLIVDVYSAGDPLWDYMATLSPPIADFDPAGGAIGLPAEYVNYVLAPGVIIVGSNGGPGRAPILDIKDQEAVDILSSLYPGRTVVQVDATNVGIGGGGMHCITQERPAF